MLMQTTSGRQCRDTSALNVIISCGYDIPVHGVGLDHDEHSKLTLGTDYLVPVSAPVKQGSKPHYAIADASERPLPYLGYSEESHLGKALANHPAFVQIADRLVAHAKSAYTETLRAGVLAGLGVAWLPYSLIRGNLEDGSSRWPAMMFLITSR